MFEQNEYTDPLAQLNILIAAQQREDALAKPPKKYPTAHPNVFDRLLHEPRLWEFFKQLEYHPNAGPTMSIPCINGRIAEITTAMILDEYFPDFTVLKGENAAGVVKIVYPDVKIVKQQGFTTLERRDRAKPPVPSPDMVIVRDDGLSFIEVTMHNETNPKKVTKLRRNQRSKNSTGYFKPKYDMYVSMAEQMDQDPALSQLKSSAFLQFFLPEDIYEKRGDFANMSQVASGKDQLAIFSCLPLISSDIRKFVNSLTTIEDCKDEDYHHRMQAKTIPDQTYAFNKFVARGRWAS